MSSFYKLNRSVESVEKLLVAWGKGAGILDGNGKPCISEFQPLSFVDIEKLQTDSERDIAIRIYLTNSLTSEVYAWLGHDEIEELVSSLKKCFDDPRGAIECAGRAFEDVLRCIARMHELDVSKQSGISQVANYLYSHRDANGNLQSSIHSKQYNIAQAIGDIRNMAGHIQRMIRTRLSGIADKSGAALSAYDLSGQQIGLFCCKPCGLVLAFVHFQLNHVLNAFEKLHLNPVTLPNHLNWHSGYSSTAVFI